MTEAEWQACEAPLPMLEFLRVVASDRKLRLLACACCRRIWDLMVYPSSRTAVEVAERFADSLALRDERIAAFTQAAREAAGWMNTCCTCHGAIGFATAAATFAAAVPDTLDEETEAAGERVSDILAIADAIWEEKRQHPLVISVDDAAVAASGAAAAWAEAEHDERDSIDETLRALEDVIIAGGRSRAAAVGMRAVSGVDDEQAAAQLVQAAEQEAQVTLIRDIFGNPFSWPAVDSVWFTSTAVALARQMYESRDFSAMPILADALQDAGCDNPDILDHCRGPGPHVRGCFVVDLVLKKG